MPSFSFFCQMPCIVLQWNNVGLLLWDLESCFLSKFILFVLFRKLRRRKRDGERKWERERENERLLMHQFTPYASATSQLELEFGTEFTSLTWRQDHSYIIHSFYLIHIHIAQKLKRQLNWNLTQVLCYGIWMFPL